MKIVTEDSLLQEGNIRITHEGVTYDILPSYWLWRSAGFKHEFHVRYPVGWKNRHLVDFSILGGATKESCLPLESMDYITSRKKIYLPLYCELVRKEPLFYELKQMLENGENLLIQEVDGPHGSSLPYYKKRYAVEDDFITDNSMEVNYENIKIMLEDPKHPFGHGYRERILRFFP